MEALPPADLVLLNGKIHSFEPYVGFQEALAVKNGWIIDLGSNRDVKEHVAPGTKVIDVQGNLVLPGTHDSHLHAAYAGLYLDPNFLRLGEDVTTVQTLRDRIRSMASTLPKGTWILGTGFKSDHLEECIREERQLTRYDIDDVCREHPLMLTDGGLHRLLLNSLALKLVDFDLSIPQLPKEQGVIVKDPVTGEPTGLFEGFGAQAIVGAKAKHLDDGELEDCILRMQSYLNQFGITGHTEIAGIGGNHLFAGTAGERVVHAYERLNRRGALTARVAVEILPGLDGIQSYETITRGLDQTALPHLTDKTWVKAGCVKIFGDDGWQRDDFQGPKGFSYFPGSTEEEQARDFRRTILEVHKRGYQMGIHLTGGKAVDIAIDAMAEAQQTYPRETPRHFLIHGDKLSKKGARTCIKYGIGLSSQASGGYFFGSPSPPRTQEEMDRGVCQQQRYTDMGLVVSHGSDGPALPMNWLLGLQYLVSRVNRRGEVCSPKLACNLEDAIKMYTINGAYQEHMENYYGSIRTNGLADLQVLDTDLFQTPPEEIGKAKVLMTLVAGKVVYEA